MLIAGCSKSGGTNAQSVPLRAAAEPAPASADPEVDAEPRAAVHVRHRHRHRVVQLRPPPDPRRPRPDPRPYGRRSSQRVPAGLPAAGRQRLHGQRRRIPAAPCHHARRGRGRRRIAAPDAGRTADPAGRPASRPDAALTFVVDVSGSMSEAGRLDLVQDALHTLVDQLRRHRPGGDRLVRDGGARAAGDDPGAQPRRPCTGRSTSCAPGGSTNLEAGLVTGYRVAREGFVTGATQPGDPALGRPGQHRQHRRPSRSCARSARRRRRRSRCSGSGLAANTATR